MIPYIEKTTSKIYIHKDKSSLDDRCYFVIHLDEYGEFKAVVLPGDFLGFTALSAFKLFKELYDFVITFIEQEEWKK